jgi:hypothetical protein
MPTSEHRWIVDAVGDGVARVEVDGGAVVTVPRWLLPAGVREGEVLRVTHDRGRRQSTVRIERDPEATRQARTRAAERLAERALPPAPDARGDIEL